MFTNRSNPGSLIVGAALILFGLLALAGQIFRGFDFWGVIWPFLSLVSAHCSSWECSAVGNQPLVWQYQVQSSLPSG
jgi:hypothetical protein